MHLSLSSTSHDSLTIWELHLCHLEAGCVQALGTESSEWQEKKRGGTVAGAWVQEGNHSDSNNTLPLISLISSFLWLKVYYSGKSAAVVFSWNETLPTWIMTVHVWEAMGYNQGYITCSSTYTYFCSLVIRIRLWYHLHLGTQKAAEKEREHIRKVKAACWVLRSSQTASLWTHPKMYFM